MMLVNSVANGIFMITIACSFFYLGVGGIPHSREPLENTTMNQPLFENDSSKNQTVESSEILLQKAILSLKQFKDNNVPAVKNHTVVINDKQFSGKYNFRNTKNLEENFTLSTLLNELIENQKVNESKIILQIKQNSELISDYQNALRRIIELEAKNLDAIEKLATAQTHIFDLKNHQNQLQAQSVDEKKNHDNIIKEKDISIHDLRKDLNQSQEKISNNTGNYNKLNEKYLKLEKSYSIEQEKIKTIINELDNEKKNYKTLFDTNEELNNKLSQLNNTFKNLNEEKEKTFAEYLDINNKYNKSSEELITYENLVQSLNNKIVDLENNKETQFKKFAEKSAELEDLKIKNSVESRNLNNKIDELTNKNKEYMNQQSVLNKNLQETEEKLSIKSSELDNHKQKHSDVLFNLNREIDQLKKDNKQFIENQKALEKKLEQIKTEARDLADNLDYVNNKFEQQNREKSSLARESIAWHEKYEILRRKYEKKIDTIKSLVYRLNRLRCNHIHYVVREE